MCACKYTDGITHWQIYMQIHMNKCIHIHAHVCTHIHTHTKCTHVWTCQYTITHTHTFMYVHQYRLCKYAHMHEEDSLEHISYLYSRTYTSIPSQMYTHTLIYTCSNWMHMHFYRFCNTHTHTLTQCLNAVICIHRYFNVHTHTFSNIHAHTVLIYKHSKMYIY